MNKKDGVLVVFGKELPPNLAKSVRMTSEVKTGAEHKYDVIIASKNLQPEIESAGFKWQNLENFVEPGSIYKASAFSEELSRLKLADGNLLAKSFKYKGYEMWWMYYNGLFLYFCLPYTQYKKLLEYLKDFKNIHLFESPYKSLFSCFLTAYGCKLKLLAKPSFKSRAFLPFGVFLQIFLTLIYLPALMVSKRRLMVFIGDKFEKNRDYDFRMRFIYQELRQKNLPFVEFIRSLESWKVVLQHVFVRKRPVIYSEAVAFAGKFLNIVSGGRSRARREFGLHIFGFQKPEEKFKFLVATQFLLGVYDDIWATRIMKWILRTIGIKAAFVAASLDRNFHAVLGCKLNSIPTVGILHGVASRHYNLYDFLPGFNGDKSLSVDKYGVWSEWWKEYYIKNSQAYRPEQLYVSGPMRPLEKSENASVPDVVVDGLNTNASAEKTTSPVRVLFVSEQLAVPHEVIPYLEELLKHTGIEVMFTFRHHRDGFREWLLKNKPQLLEHPRIKIAESGLQNAITNSDVAVGSHSTAVLEMLLSLKTPIFFQTQKWGDYYGLKEYDQKHTFFAENPDELVAKIKNVLNVPVKDLHKLQERYFGNPYKNGSKWVVAQLEEALLNGRATK